MLDRRHRICFFVTLAFVDSPSRSFLLMLAKFPADMLPQINSAGLWVKAAPPKPTDSAKVVRVKSETCMLVPSPRIPTAMGSEAALSPRDACLRIGLDANPLYSYIHAYPITSTLLTHPPLSPACMHLAPLRFYH